MVNIHNEQTDLFFDCLLALENRDECYKFFEDICTPKEIDWVSQRVKVAKMIKEGHVYVKITKETGASTATISRVRRSLDYGNDAYSMVFDRIK